jgi:hypothetical protein
LPSGNVVAVKQLYIKNMHIGMDELLNEVVLITGMKHRNLVNLRGCCLRENQRLLVYEYVDNYDVDQVLLGMSSARQAHEQRPDIWFRCSGGQKVLQSTASG